MNDLLLVYLFLGLVKSIIGFLCAGFILLFVYSMLEC
jgi:hypothetical protein